MRSCAITVAGIVAGPPPQDVLPVHVHPVHSCTITVVGIALKPPPRDVLPAHVHQCQPHSMQCALWSALSALSGRGPEKCHVQHRQHTVASGGDMGCATTDASLFSLALRLWLPACPHIISLAYPLMLPAASIHLISSVRQQLSEATSATYKAEMTLTGADHLQRRGAPRNRCWPCSSSPAPAGVLAAAVHADKLSVTTSTRGRRFLHHQRPAAPASHAQAGSSKTPRNAASSGVCSRTFAGLV